MPNLNSRLSPETWLRVFLSSKAVREGAVIRRKVRAVERSVSMDRFIAEIRRRGDRAAENSGQIVIFGNLAPVRWLTTEGRECFPAKKAG
jgi:hypothetical protein